MTQKGMAEGSGWNKGVRIFVKNKFSFCSQNRKRDGNI